MIVVEVKGGIVYSGMDVLKAREVFLQNKNEGKAVRIFIESGEWELDEEELMIASSSDLVSPAARSVAIPNAISSIPIGPSNKETSFFDLNMDDDGDTLVDRPVRSFHEAITTF